MPAKLQINSYLCKKINQLCTYTILTMVVSDEVFLLWQNWLQSVYLPIVKTSGTIEKVRVFKLLDAPEKHYAVHCETSSPAQLMHFIEKYYPSTFTTSS